jgi:hypothetical protein
MEVHISCIHFAIIREILNGGGLPLFDMGLIFAGLGMQGHCGGTSNLASTAHIALGILRVSLRSCDRLTIMI